MSFFNQQDLNTYIAGIQPKLGTDKLVTFSEYQSHLEEGSVRSNLNYISNQLSQSTDIISRDPRNPSSIIKDKASFYNQYSIAEQREEFINKLAETICGEDISESYGQGSIHGSMIPGVFEMLLRVPGNYKADESANKFKYNTLEYTENKISKIKAFIVVQKGECKKYMNTYTIKLVCGKEKGDAIPLIGAYCYMIAKNNERTGSRDKGILEMIGLYKNVSGLCSYTKFGFEEDIDLLDDENCYTNFADSLPMSANISRYQPPSIYIDIVNTNRGVMGHTICKIKNEESKIITISLYNILYILKALKQMKNAYEISYNPESKKYAYSYKGSNPKGPPTRKLFDTTDLTVLNLILDKHGITPDELVNSIRHYNPDPVNNKFNGICAIIRKYIGDRASEGFRDSRTVTTPALSPSSSSKNGGYKKRSKKSYKKGSRKSYKKGRSRKSSKKGSKSKSRRN